MLANFRRWISGNSHENHKIKLKLWGKTNGFILFVLWQMKTSWTSSPYVAQRKQLQNASNNAEFRSASRLAAIWNVYALPCAGMGLHAVRAHSHTRTRRDISLLITQSAVSACTLAAKTKHILASIRKLETAKMILGIKPQNSLFLLLLFKPTLFYNFSYEAFSCSREVNLSVEVQLSEKHWANK